MLLHCQLIPQNSHRAMPTNTADDNILAGNNITSAPFVDSHRDMWSIGRGGFVPGLSSDISEQSSAISTTIADAGNLAGNYIASPQSLDLPQHLPSNGRGGIMSVFHCSSSPRDYGNRYSTDSFGRW